MEYYQVGAQASPVNQLILSALLPGAQSDDQTVI
jgi:hypothetical protein